MYDTHLGLGQVTRCLLLNSWGGCGSLIREAPASLVLHRPCPTTCHELRKSGRLLPRFGRSSSAIAMARITSREQRPQLLRQLVRTHGFLAQRARKREERVSAVHETKSGHGCDGGVGGAGAKLNDQSPANHRSPRLAPTQRVLLACSLSTPHCPTLVPHSSLLTLLAAYTPHSPLPAPHSSLLHLPLTAKLASASASLHEPASPPFSPPAPPSAVVKSCEALPAAATPPRPRPAAPFGDASTLPGR